MTYPIGLIGDAPREGAAPAVAFGVGINDACNELKRLDDDWVSITPTIGSGLTIGNGVRTGFYRRTMGLVQFYGGIEFGTTTTSVGSPIVVNNVVPSSGVAVTALDYAVNVCLLDLSTSYHWDLQGSWNRLTGLRIQQRGSETALANTVPWVWTTGDRIMWSGSVRMGTPTTAILR